MPPGSGERLHSRTQVGPIPIVHRASMGASAVALWIPPANAAALAAVLYDLPVRGQQCVARHLRLPHLQQEPSLKVTQPWGAYGCFYPSRLWAVSRCGLRLAPLLKPPRGSCFPKIMALRLQLLLTQGSIVQSKSTNFPVSLGTLEWWNKRLNQAEEPKAWFKHTANVCETKESHPPL